jgi:hypothetical protein
MEWPDQLGALSQGRAPDRAVLPFDTARFFFRIHSCGTDEMMGRE